MNATLLRHVHRHILDAPSRFSAAQWAWASNIDGVLQRGEAPVEFRCCIAGHVLLLGGTYSERALLVESVRRDDGFLGRQARDVLRLTPSQHTTLFYPSQWAEPFRSRYYLSQAGAEEARVAADFLAHFLDQHSVGAVLPLAPDRAPLVPTTASPAAARVARR